MGRHKKIFKSTHIIFCREPVVIARFTPPIDNLNYSKKTDFTPGGPERVQLLTAGPGIIRAAPPERGIQRVA